MKIEQDKQGVGKDERKQRKQSKLEDKEVRKDKINYEFRQIKQRKRWRRLRQK